MTVDIATLALRVDALEVRTGTKALSDLEKQAGKTEKEVAVMSKGVSRSFAAVAVAARTVAGGMAALAGTAFILKRAVDEAQQYQNALNGLASVARYAGMDITTSMSKATALTADGILSVNESATALKNLLSRGFSTDQAVEMINRFKDAAAFGKQGSLEFGQAVVSATEGIKNENSVLVDNAGVTKNVSVMWKEYAASINKTVNDLTIAEKRQAEYNGILRETEAQVGNAALAAQGMTGASARMNKAFNDTSVTIEQTFMPAAIALTNALTEGLSFAVDNGVKPFLFMLENIGITAGEIMAKMGVFGEYLSSPGKWLNPAKAQKEMEAQFKVYSDLADQMRMDVAKRLEGAVTPQLGADTGARRNDVIIADEAATKKAEKRRKAIEDMIAALEKESITYRMTATQVKIYEAAQLGMTKKQLEHTIALIEGTAAREEAAKVEESLQKQLESGTEAYNTYWNSVAESTTKINENAAQLEAENAMIGKTAEEISKLTSVREDVAIATLESTMAVMRSNEASDAEVRAVALQVEALYRLKAAREQKPLLVEAAKQVEEETKLRTDMWKKVDDVARDTFVNIWGHGKSALDRLRDTLKNGLLAMLYEMGKKQFLINVGVVGTGVGATGAAQAATGMSGFGGFLDVTGLIGGSLGTFGTGIASAMSTGIITGFSNGITALGLGQTGAGLGMMAPGLAIGALALSSLFGGRGTPTSNLGNAAMQFSATGERTGYQTFFGGSNAATDKMITDMQKAYMQAAMGLGISAAATEFRYGANTGRNGQSPGFALGGGVIGQAGFYQPETSMSDAAVRLAASRAVFAALQGSELPDYLSKVFDSLVAGNMTQEQIDNTLAFAQAIKNIHSAITETRSPLQIARDNVVLLSSELGSSFDTIKTDFVAVLKDGVTPEQLSRWQLFGQAVDTVTAGTQAISDLMSGIDYQSATLGMSSLNKTLYDISRATNDAIGKATELGAAEEDLARIRDVHTQLTQAAIDANNKAISDLVSGIDYQSATLGMSSLNKTLYDISRATNDAIGKATELGAAEEDLARIRDVHTQLTQAAIDAESERISSINLGIQQQIDVLQKTQTQRQVDLANALRDADASTVGLIEQLFQLQDAAVIDKERAGLQDQLNQLTLTETQLRGIQRDALDVSNRALFDSIVLAQDSKKVEDERRGLQDQLNQLTLTSVELLRLQRDALDESNRALFDSVVAATNAKELSAITSSTSYDAIIMSMGAFDKQLFDLRRTVDNTMAKAEELGATEEQLNDIRNNGIMLIEQATNAERERLNAAVEASRRSVAGAFEGFVSRAKATADAVRAAQDAITSGYLAAQDKVASAQKAIADMAQQAAQEMRGFADNIKQFLMQLRTTDLGGGSKFAQLTALMAAFTLTAGQASAGDTAALGSVTGQAQALLEVKRATAVSAVEYARFAGRIANTLESVATLADGRAGPLADAVDPMVAATQELEAAQRDLAMWQKAAAESGATTARVTVDYAADWRKAAADNATAQYELMQATFATRDINLQQLTELEKLNALIAEFNSAKAAATAIPAAAVPTPAPTTAPKTATTPAQATTSAAVQAMTEMQAINNARSLGYAGMRNLAIEAYNAFRGRGSFANVEAQFGSASNWGQAFFGRAGGFSAEELRQRYSFAVGTNEVPFDMTANIHRGEEIKPKAFVDKEKDERADTNALLTAIRTELAAIKQTNYKMWQIADKHDIEGMPEVRVEL